MANYLSPLFNEQTFDSNGDPLSGGKIYTYAAGTSTALETFTTQTGSTQQANPIILNARASGVMSFICNHDGVVYQKNLREKSADIATKMKQFNPDASWQKTE